MANGHMGKKIDDSIRQKALLLIAKGNTVTQVASRLGISQSVVRNWVRDSGKPDAGKV